MSFSYTKLKQCMLQNCINITLSPGRHDFSRFPKYTIKPGDICFMLKMLGIKPWSSDDDHVRVGLL